MSEIAPAEDLEDLYENAPCGFVSLTPDGRIAKLNRTFAGWLGKSPDDLIGTRFNALLSFGGRIAYETHISPILRMKGRADEIALDLLAGEDAKISVFANATEKRAEDGTHLFTRIAMFTAVDRRRYERALLHARDQATQEMLAGNETAHLREQFIAVLGHDLRNPLAAIGSGIQLLGRQPLSDRGTRIVDEMRLSVARATLLIDNVLDFARGRLGEGLILAKDAQAPLTPVLEQVVDEVRVTVPDRVILSSFDIRAPVVCDRQRLGQLLANLLSNAVTHGAPDAPIEVAARTAGESFVLSVTNGGPPMSEQTRANLFRPFFRGAVQRSRQGLGLGLFIVSEIAKAHDGAMDVQSLAAGTRFAFSMPRHGSGPAG